MIEVPVKANVSLRQGDILFRVGDFGQRHWW
jgi:hypothetical protein